MKDPIGIPACFSSGNNSDNDPSAVTRSGQTVFMSMYRTKVANQCRLITVTWCKNLLLHGLAVSVEEPEGDSHYSCKIELKPWYFWRKQGSKQFQLDDKTIIDIFWDLKCAKFNGETEPQSDYYVAVVCEEEVILLLGDLKKDAYKKTKCRPSLIDPMLVSKKEHIFGKRKISTKAKFHEKGNFHEISIECKKNATSVPCNGFEPEMEIRIDGDLVVHVKQLQWKFRGNEAIFVNKVRVEVYWDVHDWLFCHGLRHALFIFRPTSSPVKTKSSVLLEGYDHAGVSGHCLFLYGWKVE